MHDRFKLTYFEECEDRIIEAEEGLSRMQEGDTSSDTINQVFRAIHSIKGGAGAFAFDQIVNFSHQFETALDFVREERLEPDRNLCDLFLRANDIVASMIEMEKAGEQIEQDYGSEIRIELEKIVQNITGAAPKETSQTHAESQNENTGEQTWAISFRPHENILKTGNEPLFIIQALQDLGELTLSAEVDNLPSLSTLTPENCYIGWKIILKTSAPEDEIREVFDFVDDLCELNIEAQNVPLGNEPERRAPTEPEQVLKKIKRKEDRDAVENAVIGKSSIRVDLERIDQLVNLVGEMVIAQSMLQEQVRWLPAEAGGKVTEGVENLTRHMRDLQESVMAVRAQQIKSVFTRMPRIIREVSNACGKDVRLTTFGEETEVDKTVLENLIDPLTHMIRNSVDHGVETPNEREAAGKNPYGMIQLSARHKSGRIIIEVEDDGKGINREAVLAKAEKQGLITAGQTLSPLEIDNLIFKAGFSTAEKISEVSGRGVGMDVVKRNVSEMGGRISVASTPGKGCKMTLSLPLTLAVMDGMVVSVGSQRFVLPTINIIESFQPARAAIGKLANGVNVIRARGEYVRAIPLFSLFNINDAITQPEDALFILLESDEGDRLSVMVDDVLGQQQVVIKSLETNFRNVEGISAATILGNGDVALILDVPGLNDMEASIDLCAETLKSLKHIKDIEDCQPPSEAQNLMEEITQNMETDSLEQGGSL